MGKKQWHWHSFHSSQYDVSSPGNWSTAAANCIWPRSALEMDSCPWTVRLHWATEEQGQSRLHQSQDLMLCPPSATKQRRCDVCDEITDVFHKLSPISSNWRWHGDLGEVCVWMYDISDTAEGVDDAILDMSARRCHQAGIIKSHVVNSIPPKHSELCRLAMDKGDTIWQISGQNFHYYEEMPAAD